MKNLDTLNLEEHESYNNYVFIFEPQEEQGFILPEYVNETRIEQLFADPGPIRGARSAGTDRLDAGGSKSGIRVWVSIPKERREEFEGFLHEQYKQKKIREWTQQNDNRIPKYMHFYNKDSETTWPPPGWIKEARVDEPREGYFKKNGGWLLSEEGKSELLYNYEYRAGGPKEKRNRKMGPIEQDVFDKARALGLLPQESKE